MEEINGYIHDADVVQNRTGKQINLGHEENTKFEEFLTHMQIAKQCSAETLKAYRSDLNQFRKFMQEQGLYRTSQFNHVVLGKYIQAMRKADNPRFKRVGLSEASIARRLAAVSAYLEFCRHSGQPNLKNPIKAHSMKWRRNREPKPVDEYSLDFLLASMTSRDRVLFSMFVASGLRISEMHQLDRDSIEVVQEENRQTGEVMATGRGEVIGKGGKRRTFFIDEKTLQELAAYIKNRTDDNPALFISERNRRLSKRAMQWALDHWCKKAEFEHINVHRLRHTFATRMANNGINSTILKDLMGHSSFNTTQQYFKLTEKTLAQGYFSAMEEMNYLK